MKKTETHIQDYLKDSFVSGFGVLSSFPFIDFSSKNSREIYRLWIDSDWQVIGMNLVWKVTDDQAEVLKLNELRNLNTKSVTINSQNDLVVEFDKNKELRIAGNPKDKKCIELIRFMQIEPEYKMIWINTRI